MTDFGVLPASDVFGSLVRYLVDYLCSEQVFDLLTKRLLSIIDMRVRDEAALRMARRP